MTLSVSATTTMPGIPSLHFEPAIDTDFDALVALRIAAMRESLERIGRFDPDRARERFRSGFDPARTRHIVAGDMRVGFVVTKPEASALLLDHLYIHPDHQGQGLGSAVLRMIIAEADELGLPIRLGALRGSDSNRFYQRHGFVQTEEAEWDIYYLRPASAR